MKSLGWFKVAIMELLKETLLTRLKGKSVKGDGEHK